MRVSKVLYKQKMDRLKKKTRTKKIQERKGLTPRVVMFDERKDKGLVRSNDENKVEVKIVENCSVVVFPSNDYEEKRKYMLQRVINTKGDLN